MTVQTEIAQQLYTGNGAATNFAWSNMKVIDADHVRVSTIVIATQVATIRPSSEYTVNGVGSDAGSVDFLLSGVPLPSTHQLLVERIVPYTQEVNIDNEGGFLPEVIEQQLDLMVMQIQQLKQIVADLTDGGLAISLTGAVAGPAVSVNNNFAGFNGTSGNLLKDLGFGSSAFAAAAHTHVLADITDKETIISPSQITSNQNNYNPTGLSGAEIVRLDSDAVNRQLTGLATGAAGRVVVLANTGLFDITLRNENASSTAGNRFAFYGAKAFILGPKKSIEIYYDTTSSRWRSRQESECRNILVLAADVINNNGSADTLADVTALSFGIISGIKYKFKFFIVYDAAATTTGSRWSVNGPAITDLAYRSTYGLTTTTITTNDGLGAYNLPAASNASSPATTDNLAKIEGMIESSADGSLIARFASEISASAITAKDLFSYVEYEAISA